jgi:arylsulfatase A-like enzyme
VPDDSVRNVVLILTDQHRASASGYAGDPLALTPRLDALARQGTVFTGAHTPSPVCVPARQSLITGRYPHAHGAMTNGQWLGPEEVTLGHVAAKAGMATAAIGKMHFAGPERHYGFGERWDYEDYARAEPRAAGDAASGMAYRDRYGERAPGQALPTLPATNPLDRAYWAGPSPFSAEAHVESYVTRESIRFMEQHRDERFLLVCSYFKPHDPMTPPAEFWDLYAGREIPAPPRMETEDAALPAAMRNRRRVLGVDGFGEDEWRAAIRGYYGNLAFVDREIGRVLDALSALGLDEETLVIYTSDHGELLGDARHGGHAGKQVFYDAAWRVPLVVRHPGLGKMGTAATAEEPIPALVDLVDLFPTVAEAAGLPLPAGRHGESLIPELSGEHTWARVRDHVFSQLHFRNATRPHYGVRTVDWKLALYEPGEEQLFDLRNDPDERLNLYREAPERVDELRELLAADLALT